MHKNQAKKQPVFYSEKFCILGLVNNLYAKSF